MIKNNLNSFLKREESKQKHLADEIKRYATILHKMELKEAEKITDYLYDGEAKVDNYVQIVNTIYEALLSVQKLTVDIFDGLEGVITIIDSKKNLKQKNQLSLEDSTGFFVSYDRRIC